MIHLLVILAIIYLLAALGVFQFIADVIDAFFPPKPEYPNDGLGSARTVEQWAAAGKKWAIDELANKK